MAVKAATSTTTISIRIEKDYLAYLKKLSHTLSLERDEDLNYSDLIREALADKFPISGSVQIQKQRRI